MADTPGVPVRLLIVDDNLPYRAGMVRAAMAHPEFEVVAEAEGGAEALEEIERHAPDLALVDLRMPRVDGIEVCRRIPQLEPAVGTRLVILSAAIEPEVHQIAMDAGAVRVLTKDLSRREILTTLLEIHTS